MIKDLIPLDRVLKRRAALTPRKTFIKFNGKKFRFRDIDHLADVYASFLPGPSLVIASQKRSNLVLALGINSAQARSS